MKRISILSILAVTAATSASAATTAYWRLEEGTPGADVTAAQDSSGNGFHQTGRAGDPNYSDNVPAPFIFDPVSGATLPNTGSLDATLANARVNTVNNAAFNTSFTIEMFIKITAEPASYNGFLRRQETNASRWQIDFDHATKSAFGRGRTRWDTPDGDNTNFVTGPTGGANVPGTDRLWVDTDPGDGLVSSYDDPTDWALDGDGINDDDGWNHIAVTFDQNSQEVSFFFNYNLMQSRTLVDTDASGYVHPDAAIVFGKAGPEFETYLDEIRYSDGVLAPNQFLVAVPEPSPAVFALAALAASVLRRRRS